MNRMTMTKDSQVKLTKAEKLYLMILLETRIGALAKRTKTWENSRRVDTVRRLRDKLEDIL